MNTINIYQSFYNNSLSIRGAIIDISDIYTKALSIHNYSQEDKELIGQAIASSIFICHNQLNDGRVLLQFKGANNDNLISAQATSSGYSRVMLKNTDSAPINLSNGQLVVFHQPENVNQHQQSIIEVKDNNLIKSVEHYFSQSEQTKTSLWLYSNKSRLIGLIIQQLPQPEVDFNSIVNQINQLSNSDVLDSLLLNTFLSKLFPNDQITYNDMIDLKYGCENVSNRYKNAILTLGKDKVNEIFIDNNSLDITCEFCAKIYSFKESEVLELFD